MSAILKLQIIISLLISLIPISVGGQNYNFTVNQAEGCIPHKVKYTYTTTATIDSVTTWYWDFGDGRTSNLREPDSVLYETEGVYDITLFLRFAGGYEEWIVKPDLIQVHSTPLSDFTSSNPGGSQFFYVFEEAVVKDTSLTYSFDWTIEEFGSRNGPVQEITFPRVDTFTVIMTVTDENGCSSSSSKEIALASEIFVPNVFTPGGDDADNDHLIIVSPGDIPLRIRVYTRTGVLVYEAEGPVITWNGETASGDKLKTGVYYYTLEAIGNDPDKRLSKSGFFHMYRKD